MRQGFCFFFLLPLLVACQDSKKEDLSGRLSMINVDIIKPQEILIERKLIILGNITPFKEVAIIPDITGKIRQINKDEGCLIRKDDIIAVVDKEPFELSVKKAESELEQAKTNLLHAETSFKESLLAIEKSFYEIEKMKIQVEQIRLEFEETERDFKNKQVLYDQEGISTSAFKKAELQYQEAKAKYELMKKDLDIQCVGFRDQDLQRELGFVPENGQERIEKIKEIRTLTEKAKVDIAKSACRKSELELSESRLMLSKCDILSPQDGLIGVRKINEGEQIQRDTPIFLIFSAEKVYIEFEVNESEVIKIRKGMKIDVLLDAYPDLKMQTSVESISPVINQKNRTGLVKAVLRNAQQNFKPGMFVRGVFYPEEKSKATIIPKKVLINLQDNKGEILIVKNGIALSQKIQIDRIEEENVFVLEGLKGDEQIIIPSNADLFEGVKVRIK